MHGSFETISRVSSNGTITILGQDKSQPITTSSLGRKSSSNELCSNDLVSAEFAQSFGLS